MEYYLEDDKMGLICLNDQDIASSTYGHVVCLKATRTKAKINNKIESNTKKQEIKMENASSYRGYPKR